MEAKACVRYMSIAALCPSTTPPHPPPPTPHAPPPAPQVTVVFAQLTVDGKWEGPHVFVVRIRDDAMRVMPGVRIRDMGPKMGLNGVDNGGCWLGLGGPRRAGGR